MHPGVESKISFRSSSGPGAATGRGQNLFSPRLIQPLDGDTIPILESTKGGVQIGIPARSRLNLKGTIVPGGGNGTPLPVPLARRAVQTAVIIKIIDQTVIGGTSAATA